MIKSVCTKIKHIVNYNRSSLLIPLSENRYFRLSNAFFTLKRYTEIQIFNFKLVFQKSVSISKTYFHHFLRFWTIMTLHVLCIYSWTLQHIWVANPFPNKPLFLRVCCTSLLKTLCEKEKLLVTSNFSFFHSVFYPFGELCTIFIEFEIVVCKLLQFGKV